MSREDLPVAEQAVAAWQELLDIATNRGHDFAEHHEHVLAITNLPITYASVFSEEHKEVPVAKDLLTAVSDIASSIHATSDKYPKHHEYFTTNSKLWIAGLKSSQLYKLGTQETQMRQLADVHFGTSPAHPSISDHTGFAYALLRSFLVYLQVSGNFARFKELNRRLLLAYPRNQLLLGLSADENIEKANTAIQACLAACIDYCDSLTYATEASPSAIEHKVVDTPPSPAPSDPESPAGEVEHKVDDMLPSPAPSVSTPPSDDEIDSPKPVASDSSRDPFTDDESDGDTHSDIDEFKLRLFTFPLARPNTPPRPPTPPNTPQEEVATVPSHGLLSAALATVPGVPPMQFFTSSAYVPPLKHIMSAPHTEATTPVAESKKTQQATQLLVNIETYLQQRGTEKPGWVSHATSDYDKRQKSYDDICNYIRDIEVVDDPETMGMLSDALIKFIRIQIRPFQTIVPFHTIVPYIGTQEFHDGIENICTALAQEDGISIEDLQIAIKKLHPTIESTAHTSISL
ncbi:MAG: hypothetical protein P1U63_01510 [Coxiellaceae bacterium]|nr:hypothetical protein [Coxiellaceae bacterium]